ncbi:reverse transcriptase domain-containing protein [Tanacetum coccineum]
MPFGLCNAPVTFQRCVIAIFHEIIEDNIEGLEDRQDKAYTLRSKTMNEAQENYTTTKKELLAVVFAFDKFREYLVLSKTIVFTDHSALWLTKAEIRDLFLEERLMAIFDKNNKLWLVPGGGKLKSRWYRPFLMCKDMKNDAIELYDKDGNEFIVDKQRVKPYQESVFDTNRDDDITLDDEGEVT